MTGRFSPPWFTLLFCMAYLASLTLNQALFLYYPLVGQFSLSPLDAAAGPPMLWYGLMANAAVAGLLAGIVLPQRWLPDRLIAWSWLVPVATMAGVALDLRAFFA